jgi:hypothetical protein
VTFRFWTGLLSATKAGSFSVEISSFAPGIRSGWWNSRNGSVLTCSRRFPTGMLSLASRRSDGGSFQLF